MQSILGNDSSVSSSINAKRNPQNYAILTKFMSPENSCVVTLQHAGDHSWCLQVVPEFSKYLIQRLVCYTGCSMSGLAAACYHPSVQRLQ